MALMQVQQKEFFFVTVLEPSNISMFANCGFSLPFGTTKSEWIRCCELIISLTSCALLAKRPSWTCG